VTLLELHTASPGVQRAYALIADPVDHVSGRRPEKLLGDLPLCDVFTAYLMYTADLEVSVVAGLDAAVQKSRALRTARTIAANTFALQSTSMEAVITFIDFATAHPEAAEPLAWAIASANPVWPTRITLTRDLGRVARTIYDATKVDRLVSRTDYLTQHLADGYHLSDEQRTLALAICPEWAGTLDELEETARALRP
jgi:hypothetical protein